MGGNCICMFYIFLEFIKKFEDICFQAIKQLQGYLTNMDDVWRSMKIFSNTMATELWDYRVSCRLCTVAAIIANVIRETKQ